jgi:hypothetical protein
MNVQANNIAMVVSFPIVVPPQFDVMAGLIGAPPIGGCLLM